MAETGKKVEVRYGAFACTIEGYDNPAEQLQQILAEMQKMIAETPQFSKVSSGSEAQDLQEALQPKDEDEAPSPGIVIIRDSDESTASRTERSRDVDNTVADAEEVAERDLAESPSDELEQPEEVAEAEAIAVEAPELDAEDTVSDEPVNPEADPATDEGAEANFAGMATGAAAVAAGATVYSAFTSDEEQTGEFQADADDFDQTPSSENVADQPTSEIQSDPWDVPEAEAADATPAEESEVEEDAEPDLENTLAAPETRSPQIDAAPTEFVEASDSTETQQATETEESRVASDADDAVNIFGAPVETDTQAQPQRDTVAEQVAPSQTDTDEPNIFASPEDAAAVDVNIFADTPVEDAPAETAAPELTTAQSFVSDETQSDLTESAETIAETAAETETNIFAAPEDVQTKVASAVADEAEPEAAPINIFAAPEEAPVEEVSESPIKAGPNSKPVEKSLNIFAAPEEVSAPENHEETVVEAPGSSDQIEEVVNIFAAPAAQAVSQSHDTIQQATASATDIWEDATETLEQATPGTVRQKLDDLGDRVSQLASSPPEVTPVDTVSSEQDAGFSIFADSAPVATETQQPPVSDAPEQGQKTSNRFQSLLQRTISGPVMGAPGEPDQTEASSAEPVAQLAPGVTSAAELARHAGSDSVSDLLAASAAWLTLAEGKSRFSRRDVMDVFEKIPGDHARTLEARIKGYGKLVRSGMLVLVDDGVFAMAQSERERFQTMLNRG